LVVAPGASSCRAWKQPLDVGAPPRLQAVLRTNTPSASCVLPAAHIPRPTPDPSSGSLSGRGLPVLGVGAASQSARRVRRRQVSMVHGHGGVVALAVGLVGGGWAMIESNVPS